MHDISVPPALSSPRPPVRLLVLAQRVKVMTQVLTPVADRFGTYRVIMWAAVFKLVAGSLMWAAGGQAWPLWTLLFLGNRLASTAWGFYNLSFADVREGGGEGGRGGLVSSVWYAKA